MSEIEELKAEVEALRAEVERLRDEGAWAVRWAPGSAYWSAVLEELFGPGARIGIDVLETRWRKELERAEKLEEALRLAEEHISDLTPEWYNAGQRVLAAIRAAKQSGDAK